MDKNSVEAIVGALEAAEARYLIAGGLAVVAHGYVRFTADLDLILDLEEANLRRGLAALKALGYRPRAPVPIEEFADAARRASWIEEKGLKVFWLNSDLHKGTEIDVFVEAPFEFAPAYEVARRESLAGGAVARFLDLDRLIGLKRRAGRPRDLDDIARLEELRGEGGHERP